MPSTQTASVKQIRTAHELIADPCASIPQNPTPGDRPMSHVTVSSDAELLPKQNLAIGHLIAGRSYTETAQLANVDRRTLYEWRKQPAFSKRLDELSREALEAVAMRTRNLLLRGTDRLERALEKSATFGETLRLISNKRILDMAHVMPHATSEEADHAVEESKGGAKEKTDEREQSSIRSSLQT